MTSLRDFEISWATGATTNAASPAVQGFGALSSASGAPDCAVTEFDGSARAQPLLKNVRGATAAIAAWSASGFNLPMFRTVPNEDWRVLVSCKLPTLVSGGPGNYAVATSPPTPVVWAPEKAAEWFDDVAASTDAGYGWGTCIDNVLAPLNAAIRAAALSTWVNDAANGFAAPMLAVPSGVTWIVGSANVNSAFIAVPAGSYTPAALLTTMNAAWVTACAASPTPGFASVVMGYSTGGAWAAGALVTLTVTPNVAYTAQAVYTFTAPVPLFGFPYPSVPQNVTGVGVFTAATPAPFLGGGSSVFNDPLGQMLPWMLGPQFGASLGVDAGARTLLAVVPTLTSAYAQLTNVSPSFSPSLYVTTALATRLLGGFDPQPATPPGNTEPFGTWCIVPLAPGAAVVGNTVAQEVLEQVTLVSPPPAPGAAGWALGSGADSPWFCVGDDSSTLYLWDVSGAVAAMAITMPTGFYTPTTFLTTFVDAALSPPPGIVLVQLAWSTGAWAPGARAVLSVFMQAGYFTGGLGLAFGQGNPSSTSSATWAAQGFGWPAVAAAVTGVLWSGTGGNTVTAPTPMFWPSDPGRAALGSGQEAPYYNNLQLPWGTPGSPMTFNAFATLPFPWAAYAPGASAYQWVAGAVVVPCHGPSCLDGWTPVGAIGIATDDMPITTEVEGGAAGATSATIAGVLMDVALVDPLAAVSSASYVPAGNYRWTTTVGGGGLRGLQYRFVWRDRLDNSLHAVDTLPGGSTRVKWLLQKNAEAGVPGT